MLRDEDILVYCSKVLGTLAARRVDKEQGEIPGNMTYEVRWPAYTELTIADIKAAFEPGAAFKEGVADDGSRGDDPQVHGEAREHSESEHEE